MLCVSIFMLLMIGKSILARPFLHDHVDVLAAKSFASFIEKRSDDFDPDGYDFINDDSTRASATPQNMIASSDINYIDSEDPTIANTASFMDVQDTVKTSHNPANNGLIDDCAIQSLTGDDQELTRKRSIFSRGTRACPNPGTQAPNMGLFDFKNLGPSLKKFGSSVQQKLKPKEQNPCTGPSRSLSGAAQNVHVSCGGPKVGFSGINSDYVLNCVPGTQQSIPERYAFTATIQTLKFCCAAHYDAVLYFQGIDCYQLEPKGLELRVDMGVWTHAELAENEVKMRKLLREQNIPIEDEWFIRD